MWHSTVEDATYTPSTGERTGQMPIERSPVPQAAGYATRLTKGVRIPYRQMAGNVVIVDPSRLMGPNGTRASVAYTGLRALIPSAPTYYPMAAGEVCFRTWGGNDTLTIKVTDNAGAIATYTQPVMSTGRYTDPFSDPNLNGDGEWIYYPYNPATGGSRTLQFCLLLPTADVAHVDIIQVAGTPVTLSQTRWTYTNSKRNDKVYPQPTVTIPAGAPNMDRLGFRARVTVPSKPTWPAAWGKNYFIQLVSAATPRSKQTLPEIFPTTHWSRIPAARIPVATESDGWTRNWESVTTQAVDSALIVRELLVQSGGTYNAGTGKVDNWRIGLTTNKFAGAVYVVDSNTPRYNVGWDDFYNTGVNESKPGLQNVPIPSDAIASNGTDGHIGLYDPVADQWWEFWQFHSEYYDAGDGPEWHFWCAQGGRVDNFSQGQGQNRLPNQVPYFTVSASGLALYPTVLQAAEVVAALADYSSTNEAAWDDHINHVLNVGLPSPKKYDQCWPATNTDGSRNTSPAPWEGQRFSIDPTLDLKTLGLTRGEHIIARAMQRFGFMTTETAGSVSVGAQSGYAWRLAEGVSGVDPYAPLFQNLDGTPSSTALQWSMLSKIPQERIRAHRVFTTKAEFDAALLPA